MDRRNWVIDQMAANGYITREEAAKAKNEDLITQTRPMGIQTEDADYFVEDVRRQLYAKYGADKLYDGGLQVRATLDTRLQNFAVNALRIGLVRYDHRHGWRGAKDSIDLTGDWQARLASRSQSFRASTPGASPSCSGSPRTGPPISVLPMARRPRFPWPRSPGRGSRTPMPPSARRPPRRNRSTSPAMSFTSNRRTTRAITGCVRFPK